MHREDRNQAGDLEDPAHCPGVILVESHGEANALLLGARRASSSTRSTDESTKVAGVRSITNGTRASIRPSTCSVRDGAV